MDFIEEVTWRGMIHQMMPGTTERLKRGMTTAYIGIDPTADSLHIGHLVSVMMLKHFQRAGHKPIALVGGATGMIGDPSLKSQERNLLDEATLRHNQEAIKAQLSRFLDFDSDAPNAAVMVNNYDWMHGVSFLDFIRDVGKHITVNYMMAKDSVKKRLQGGEGQQGMSFTEFSYQLVQGYDFLRLFLDRGCELQMGGSDQWGNITTGAELVRRTTDGHGEVFALTFPLITKADGGKFGKTEKGSVWLDPKRTSPYQFYQFWLNVTDMDAEKYIKIFTELDRQTIQTLINDHKADPGQRLLQRRLAQEVTVMVHGQQEYDNAVEASRILFANNTADILHRLDEATLLAVMDGVERHAIPGDLLTGAQAVTLADLLTLHAPVFPSKGEMRKLAQGGGLSINKEKVTDIYAPATKDLLLQDRYILVQKGKKTYYLIEVKD